MLETQLSSLMESITVNSNGSITSFHNLAITIWVGAEVITKDAFMEEVEIYTTYKIATFINNYWFPFLVPIGLVGNILSFLVMTKSNNRKMSTCIYIAAISVNDNIMMCICLHDYLVSSVQIHRWTSIECKLNVFVTLFALQNSTFQILSMTLDKYIAIKWSHKAATYSTPRRAKIIVLALTVSINLYLQHSSFLYFWYNWKPVFSFWHQ